MRITTLFVELLGLHYPWTVGDVLLYEIHDIRRFGDGGKKIGNAHLKWAFSEAVCLLVRCCPAVKTWQQTGFKKSLQAGHTEARETRVAATLMGAACACAATPPPRQRGGPSGSPAA